MAMSLNDRYCATVIWSELQFFIDAAGAMQACLMVETRWVLEERMRTELRVNTALAEIIAIGVRLNSERGSVAAWVYLQQHGVPQRTILRVLDSPTTRRHTDTLK